MLAPRAFCETLEGSLRRDGWEARQEVKAIVFH